MILFFTNNIDNGTALFEGEECIHIHQSLRKREGDEIRFVDGTGGLYRGIIENQSKRKIKVQITDQKQLEPVNPYLHIAIAPTKNNDRTEWFLEKAIEMGVSEISFIRCNHSERKNIKLDRMHRVAQSACKQSMKAHFPIINDIIGLEQWLSLPQKSDRSLIACLKEETVPLAQAYTPGQTVTLCIGPEGGFRESEIEACTKAGFTRVSLGNYRLRTETAGIMSVAAIRTLNDIKP